jgi:hypothetical protein
MYRRPDASICPIFDTYSSVVRRQHQSQHSLNAFYFPLTSKSPSPTLCVASNMNARIPVWDAIVKCCLRDNDSGPIGLSIYDEGDVSTIRCDHTARSHNGITTLLGYAELQVTSGGGDAV